MSEVVDPRVLQTCAPSHPLPERLEICQVRALVPARNYKWVVICPLDTLKHGHYRLSNVYDLCARFGIRKPKSMGWKVNMFPFERHDLIEPAVGEQQERDPVGNSRVR